MKKKYIRKFIALFDCLPLAGEILSGTNKQEHDANSIIGKALQSIQEITNDPENHFLIKVFDEIDDNFYDYPHSRVEYIEDVLVGFTSFAPFLDYQAGIGWLDDMNFSFNENQKYEVELCRATIKLLIDIEDITDIDGLSDAEKYVFHCSSLLLFFARTFDARCLRFNLELMDVQDRLGIFIQRQRCYLDLVNAGYQDKVFQIIYRDTAPQKALSEPVEPQPEAVRPFPDYLRHDNPDALAAVCKEVFNVKKSPKDYAIMLCLLSMKKLIYLSEDHRTSFFDSWYAFIGKPLPKYHNYYAINKQIDIVDGLQFINDTDPAYVHLKALFDRKLKTVNPKQ